MEKEDEHVDELRYRVSTSRPANVAAIFRFPASGRVKQAKQESEMISYSKKNKHRKDAPSDTPKSSRDTLPYVTTCPRLDERS